MTAELRLPVIDYARHPAYGAVLPKPTLREQLAATARLSPFLGRAAADLYLRRRRIRRGRQLGSIARALEVEGLSTAQADASWLAELRAALGRALGTAVGTIDPGPTGLADIPVPPANHPDVAALVTAELTRLGILAAAAEYRGRDSVEVRTVVLKVSVAGREFRTGLFSDLELPDPPTRYMHVDSTAPRSVIKLLIYLDDVTEAQGPFTYVRGSHNFDETPLRAIARRAIHKSKTFQAWDPATRRRFYDLPRPLQHKAEFGNDLVDTEVCGSILELEEPVCGPAGTVVLFDNSGIHRGGLLTEGRRDALQVVLR